MFIGVIDPQVADTGNVTSKSHVTVEECVAANNHEIVQACIVGLDEEATIDR